MKRVINKKVYNTETAIEVASYWNGLSSSDFRNVTEELYITHKGNWFMSYSGGALSQYAECLHRGCYEGSSGIKVLSEDEVYQWLEGRGETGAIEKYFADRLEEA
jgi:hypothetical protein